MTGEGTPTLLLHGGPGLALTYLETIAGELEPGFPAAADALRTTEVPLSFLAGGASPLPWGLASRATAELSPQARLTVVPGAGHFVWHEAPGSVRAALAELRGASGAA